MRTLAIALEVCGIVALTAWTGSNAAAQGGRVDVTGKWVFTVQTDAGSGTPTVTLKQEGEKLSGHYSSQNLGEAELTGTVKHISPKGSKWAVKSDSALLCSVSRPHFTEITLFNSAGVR